MQIDTSKITISKTTLNGLVSCAIAVIVAVSSLPPGAKWSVVTLAGLRAVVGFMQKDGQ